MGSLPIEHWLIIIVVVVAIAVTIYRSLRHFWDWRRENRRGRR
jgi:hypothetical protein